jgi:hypothetical protein
MSRKLLLICLLLQGVALGDTPSDSSAPIPIADFLRMDTLGTVKISPDGEHVAMTVMGQDGSCALVFMSARDRKVTNRIEAPKDFWIAQLYWVSPQRLIYTISERVRGSNVMLNSGEIYAVNRDGSGYKRIFGYRARTETRADGDLLHIPKDDPENILITERPWMRNMDSSDPLARPRIARLNVYTGRKYFVEQLPLQAARLLTDRNGTVRVMNGLDGSMNPVLWWRAAADANWIPLDVPGFERGTIMPRAFIDPRGGSRAKCSCSPVAATRCCSSISAAAAVTASTLLKPESANGAARCRTI